MVREGEVPGLVHENLLGHLAKKRVSLSEAERAVEVLGDYVAEEDPPDPVQANFSRSSR
jgi:hypothetical protein